MFSLWSEYEMNHPWFQKMTFNPHQHVKIWLSHRKDVFLPLQHQYRLRKHMQGLEKNATVYLVYDSRLLADEAHRQLIEFCQKETIQYRDMVVESRNVENVSIVEKKLLELYEREILSYIDNKGGNLAAAKDILVWTPYVYTLGVYSDFHIKLKTKNLADSITAPAQVLFKIMDMYGVDYHGNDVIVASKGYLLEAIQNNLLDTYTSFLKSIRDYEVENLASLTPADFFILNEKDLCMKVFKKLVEEKNCSDIPSLRQATYEYYENTESYLQGKTISEVANAFKLKIQEKNASANLSPFYKVGVLNSRSLNNEALVEQLRISERFILIKYLILCTSGPGILNFLALQGQQNFHKFCISNTGIDIESYKNKELSDFVPMIFKDKLNKDELSWTEEGKACLQWRHDNFFVKQNRIRKALLNDINSIRPNGEITRFFENDQFNIDFFLCQWVAGKVERTPHSERLFEDAQKIKRYQLDNEGYFCVMGENDSNIIITANEDQRPGQNSRLSFQ